ncbi:uncharacterized protein HD556DRAFT_1415509 [Suillus plorans]|uniref:Uncharacterized protein n=1 Tax=Suillus plorans TaxID=116603 RepID=A0A9P7ADZ8_9AGAM|nr:uncharacterized protein HD556DRAFT_1415509 [Suillus plorans]KAG1786356.1 hypothetical protein HD556DRAFT_1415509 [Suillus plorans]
MVRGMIVLAVMSMSFPRLGAGQFSLSSNDGDDAIEDDFDEYDWMEDSSAFFEWRMRGRTWVLQIIASVRTHGISFYWQISIASGVDYHSELTLPLDEPYE